MCDGNVDGINVQIAEKDAEIQRLSKVVRVLMDRAERSTHVQGSDFGLFQTTLMLEEQVGERTARLREALDENEKVNRALLMAKGVLEQNQITQQELIHELQSAKRQLQSSEAELRQHRDHLSELVAAQTADLIRAKEVAERANALKSEFLQNMSHEFRTPLHGIVSYASLGIDRVGKVPLEKLSEYFSRIHQSGMRLNSLVDDLLDLSALESHQLCVHLQSCDIWNLIESVESELAPVIDARRLTITHSLLGEDSRAQLDPDLFRRALLKLLSNAARYSPAEGVIEIELSHEISAEGENQFLLLRIHDHGAGIPPGEEEIIFDKFVQSSATKNGAGGVGLGLAIVRDVIAQHGGRITVHNDPDGGAVFEIVVPRAR